MPVFSVDQQLHEQVNRHGRKSLPVEAELYERFRSLRRQADGVEAAEVVAYGLASGIFEAEGDAVRASPSTPPAPSAR